VQFDGRNPRHQAATGSDKQQLGNVLRRHHPATRSNSTETTLLTGGLLVRIQPEEPFFFGYLCPRKDIN
jgi:hypothetical protein